MRINLILTSALAIIMTLGSVGVAGAKGDKLPKITGGGWAENTNAGVETLPDNMMTQYGFTAHAIEEIGNGGDDNNGDDGDSTPTAMSISALSADSNVKAYKARGQFQVKNIDAESGRKVNQAHGEVVCIANRGPSNTVDGGGDDDENVWEIRVRFPDKHGVTDFDEVYGSFLFQDNGKVDYMDENFDMDRIDDDDCGVLAHFQLEEVVRGQINVHD